MLLATACLFIMALSLDSFGVGISYGLQNIKLSFSAMFIICICSCSVLAVSMLLGKVLTQFIAIELVKIIGAILLIGLGTLSLIKNFLEVLQKPDGSIFLAFNITSLGVVIQVLKEPISADADKSGVISGRESILLALALAMDSFGTGIGAALLGLPIVFTSLWVGVCAFVFLMVGMLIGRYLNGTTGYYKVLTILPGMILIMIGVSRLYL